MMIYDTISLEAMIAAAGDDTVVKYKVSEFGSEWYVATRCVRAGLCPDLKWPFYWAEVLPITSFNKDEPCVCNRGGAAQRIGRCGT